MDVFSNQTKYLVGMMLSLHCTEYLNCSFIDHLSCALLQVCKGVFPRIHDPPKYPEKILFCGWRRDIDDMIMVIRSNTIYFFGPELNHSWNTWSIYLSTEDSKTRGGSTISKGVQAKPLGSKNELKFVFFL